MIPFRRLCVAVAMGCFVVAGCAQDKTQTTTARPPNVIVIVTDDQGWGDLSVNGNRDLATPHIDSLARDGAAFDRFYACPVCAPMRAEFLTGRYHSRGGVRGVSTGQERLNTDERTVAEAFKAGGYATACIGKWHNGMQYPYHPRGRGFDEFFGFASGHWGQYFDAELEHNGEYVKTEGYCTDVFTDRAIGFIEQRKGEPFFCYLALCTPHSPMQVPDKYWSKFADAPLKMGHGQNGAHTRAALAMVENIDDNVGRVLAKLDALGIAENTIVVYLSDNGPNGGRWNDGMRGRKGSTDEGGVRVPCFVRYPESIKPGTKIEPIAGAIDLLPTLIDFAGIERVGDKPLDGVSVKPLLTGGEVEWPNRRIFSRQRDRVSVRTQRYRLDDKGRLYDMAADPGQANDVAKDHPEVAAELRAEAKRWLAEVTEEGGGADRPFTVGHADWPITELPARDAKHTGALKRSSRHPNCSYLLNWTKPGDAITWNVEVLTAGRYEAVIDYTCPAADVGATLQLAMGDATVRGKVTEAHDPPAIGAADDRSKRSESLVKDFKPLSLGVIDLRAGVGTLTLRAVDIPGAQAAEFRRLRLMRVE